MSIKKLDLSAELKIVSIQDSAICKETTSEENLKTYEESHDMSLLSLKKGEHPTYFVIKNIGPELQLEIQEEHYKVKMPTISKEMTKEEIKKAKPTMEQNKPGQMLLKYFKAGCHTYEEEGKKFPCKVDDFPLSILQEIGGFIMSRSILGDEEKKS